MHNSIMLQRSSRCDTRGSAASLECWDAALIPSLAQWVKNPEAQLYSRKKKLYWEITIKKKKKKNPEAQI